MTNISNQSSGNKLVGECIEPAKENSCSTGADEHKLVFTTNKHFFIVQHFNDLDEVVQLVGAACGHGALYCGPQKGICQKWKYIASMSTRKLRFAHTACQGQHPLNVKIC